MPEQTIKTIFENGAGYLWFVFLAIWGGTASYISRLKKNKSCFSMIELVGEWTISGFAGIITAYFCHYFGQGFFMTAALAGISGHMGGRAIFLIEKHIELRANKQIKTKKD